MIHVLCVIFIYLAITSIFLGPIDAHFERRKYSGNKQRLKKTINDEHSVNHINKSLFTPKIA